MIESKSGRSAPPYPRNVGQFRFDVVRERLSGATVAAAADEEEEEEDAGVVDDNDSDEWLSAEMEETLKSSMASVGKKNFLCNLVNLYIYIYI